MVWPYSGYSQEDNTVLHQFYIILCLFISLHSISPRSLITAWTQTSNLAQTTPDPPGWLSNLTVNSFFIFLLYGTDNKDLTQTHTMRLTQSGIQVSNMVGFVCSLRHADHYHHFRRLRFSYSPSLTSSAFLSHAERSLVHLTVPGSGLGLATRAKG